MLQQHTALAEVDGEGACRDAIEGESRPEKGLKGAFFLEKWQDREGAFFTFVSAWIGSIYKAILRCNAKCGYGAKSSLKSK